MHLKLLLFLLLTVVVQAQSSRPARTPQMSTPPAPRPPMSSPAPLGLSPTQQIELIQRAEFDRFTRRPVRDQIESKIVLPKSLDGLISQEEFMIYLKAHKKSLQQPELAEVSAKISDLEAQLKELQKQLRAKLTESMASDPKVAAILEKMKPAMKNMTSTENPRDNH